MKAFPLIKDLVTDVSWNYEVKRTIKKFKPRSPDAPMVRGACSKKTWTGFRNFESASNATCARTFVTCCANINLHEDFIGPRFLVYTAALEMHPLDTEDR